MTHIDRLVVQLDPTSGEESAARKPVRDFYDYRGIVILGDQGIGKTEELRHAAKIAETQVIPVQEAIHRTALTANGNRVFLDALDEARSSGGAGALVAALVNGDLPEFVLSCRVADWYGASDLRSIQERYGDDQIAVVRLLGFTRQQAMEFVTDHVSDPEVFIREAESRGLDKWLENPNDLLLLTKIVATGWPSTKLELYERSSTQLVREQNPDRARMLPLLAEDTLLDAAGAICASLLITGVRGICLDAGGNAQSGFATVTDFVIEPALVDRIGKSNLFVGEIPRHVKPRHRTTAEFLAARWLSKEICVGSITLRRALAILAPDGRPPTELRGTVAWLITHLPTPEALQVIGTDPFGLLIYGDADSFDISRLGGLLSALEQIAKSEPYFRVNAWAEAPWAAFIKPQLSGHLAAILNQRDANPHLLDGLVAGLSIGRQIPSVIEPLLTVIRNGDIHAVARKRAVRAYLHQRGSCGDLPTVFSECRATIVDDSQGEIRFEIFRRCHDSIDVAGFSHLIAELWDDRYVAIGSLHYKYIDSIPTPLLARILDELSGEQRRRGNLYSSGGLSPYHCGSEVRFFLEKAFARAATHGLATVERVANWHRLFLNRRGRNDEAWDELWANVNKHGELFIHIFETEVRPGDAADLWKRFVHALAISDCAVPFTPECIEYLIRCAAIEPDDDKAVAIARCATPYIWSFDQGPPLFELATTLWTTRACLSADLSRLGYWEIPPWRIKEARRSKASKLRGQREVERTRTNISRNFDGIRKWSAFNLLQFVGLLYFFGSSLLKHANSDSKLKKHEAYVQLLGPEITQQLENALVDGLLAAELPTPTDQGQWIASGQHYTGEFAVLAAMELLLDRNPIPEISDQATRSIVALAVHHWGTSRLCEELDGIAPSWFWTEFRSRPNRAIGAIIDFLEPSARKGERLSDLRPLFSSPQAALAQLADLAEAAITSLRPIDRDDLLGPLYTLITAGRSEFVSNEAKSRLTQPLTADQTLFWLAMGWLVDSSLWNDLSAAIQRNTETELWSALRVIFPERHRPARNLSITETSWLIEQFGRRFRRVDRPRGVTTGSNNAWDASEIIYQMIEQISLDPSPIATAELSRLVELPDLDSYRITLLHALASQRHRRRDKEFVIPSLKALKGIIHNTGVNTADDLVAVALDELEYLQKHYRSGDTTGWRKFWNTGKRGVINDSKIEDHCRDILLDDLRPRLSRFHLSVNQATPAHAGNEADASIQTGSGVSVVRVPVEMKMSHNPQVWTAARDQLSKKYMIDPLCGGRGIYIVFWTSDVMHPVPRPPSDQKSPSNPNEMLQLLVALLTPEERAQIAIVVIDVSADEPPRNRKGSKGYKKASRHRSTKAAARARREPSGVPREKRRARASAVCADLSASSP